MIKIVFYTYRNQCGRDANLAILKLTKPLQFNSNVQPVCLPDTSIEPKSFGWVSGWGFQEFGEWSSTLKFTNVPIYPCNNITQDMVCSFNSSDVCTGDIGGPLIVSGIKGDAKIKIDKYSRSLI